MRKIALYIILILSISSCDYFTRAKMKIFTFDESKLDENALSTLDQEISNDEDNVLLYQLKAKYLIDAKNYIEADEVLATALKLDSTNVKTLFLSSITKFNLNDYKKTLKYGEAARKLGYENLELYEIMAQASNYIEDNVLSDFYIKKIKNIDPEYEELNYLLSLNQLRTSDTLDAIFYLKKAIQDKPKNVKVYSLLAKLFIDTGEPDSADKYLNLGSVQNPNDIQILLEYAHLMKSRNRFEEYENYLIKAKSLDSANIRVTLKLCEYYMETRKYRELTTQISKIDTVLYGQIEDLNRFLGDYWYMYRKFDKAQYFFNKALLINSNNPYYKERLDRIEWRKKEISRARRDSLSNISNFVEHPNRRKAKVDSTKKENKSLFDLW